MKCLLSGFYADYGIFATGMDAALAVAFWTYKTLKTNVGDGRLSCHRIVTLWLSK